MQMKSSLVEDKGPFIIHNWYDGSLRRHRVISIISNCIGDGILEYLGLAIRASSQYKHRLSQVWDSHV